MSEEHERMRCSFLGKYVQGQSCVISKKMSKKPADGIEEILDDCSYENYFLFRIAWHTSYISVYHTQNCYKKLVIRHIKECNRFFITKIFSFYAMFYEY